MIESGRELLAATHEWLGWGPRAVTLGCLDINASPGAGFLFKIMGKPPKSIKFPWFILVYYDLFSIKITAHIRKC
jgi:hypothetical protein